MITTRFLLASEYPEYKQWLLSQDTETLQMYFGVAITESMIDMLIKRITQNPTTHHFLVAEKAGTWIGTIHIAEQNKEVEFGVLVSKDWRGHGVGDQLMAEAIVWARNRGYKSLFMQCLSWNQPIKHLCHKHGLEVKNHLGESETRVPLPPPNLISISKEVATTQRNVYQKVLENTFPIFG